MIYSEYETIYVAKPELPEDAIRAIADKYSDIIKKNDGEMLLVDDWGKRKLAYPIQKNSKGHYVYLQFMGSGEIIAELERYMRIDDSLLRFLTIKVKADIDIEATRAEADKTRGEIEAKAQARADAEAAAAASAETPNKLV